MTMSSRQPASNSLWLIGATATVTAAISFTVLWRASKRQKPSNGSAPPPFGTGVDSDSEGDDYSSLPESLKRDVEKERRRQAKIPLLAMKKPMYDNILMLDPQGTLLCTISKKKARWYVKKKLGAWKDTEETTLQLLFEPSHRSNQSRDKNTSDAEADADGCGDDNDEEDAFFNKSIKENICVVCGDDKYHMRHYIVPYSCRSLFPKRYKMHMAHDVIILCPDCHLDCKKMATTRMKFLERQCRTDPTTAIPHFVDRELYKVKSCALALLRWRHKLPPSNIEEYESLIRDHFDIPPTQELTTSTLEEATEIETSHPNPHYIPASDIIVASLCRDDAAIEVFVKGWRKHFVETMEPQYLPKGWSVNSSVECQSAERKSS